MIESGQLSCETIKCERGATQVDFLGHRLGRETVGLQDCKVGEVKDAPIPITKKIH